jgi:hypothetical protein
MPQVGLSARARKARSDLGNAIRGERPDPEIEALRIAFRAARAKGIIEAGEAELAEVRDRATALVADWPPLDDTVKAEIAALLRNGAGRE